VVRITPFVRGSNTAKKMQNLFAEIKGQLLRRLGKRQNLLEGPWLLECKPGRKPKPRDSNVYLAKIAGPFR
jgi:hypothetical protein